MLLHMLYIRSYVICVTPCYIIPCYKYPICHMLPHVICVNSYYMCYPMLHVLPHMLYMLLYTLYVLLHMLCVIPCYMVTPCYMLLHMLCITPYGTCATTYVICYSICYIATSYVMCFHMLYVLLYMLYCYYICYMCYSTCIRITPYVYAIPCYMYYPIYLTHTLFPFCSARCGLVHWLINWFVCLSVAGSYVA